MDTKNEGEEVEETLDLPEIEEGEEVLTDWKAEAQKLRDKAMTQRDRTSALKKELKEAKAKIEVAKELVQPTKTGELDENALDYLDLKGISEAEDIKVIEDVVKKTGMTWRQALKDEYVSAKLAANKTAREVKDATPSSSKRSSTGGGNELALAIAKYEQSGYRDLPADFKLRSAVVNAMVDKQDTNKPSWHK